MVILQTINQLYGLFMFKCRWVGCRKMKRSSVIVFLCVFTIVVARASSVDSVSTTHKGGEFITYTQVAVNASPSIVSAVIEDFVFQTKYDLEALFGWGLKNLKLRRESDEVIVFNFKSTQYDKKSDIIKAVGAVEIPGVVNFPEIHVNSRMTKKIFSNGAVGVDVNVLYSDAFLKSTTGVFRMLPNSIDGNCQITLETRVKFGWFFDFFITKSTYRSIMEWRFRQLLHNLKNESEARARNLNK